MDVVKNIVIISSFRILLLHITIFFHFNEGTTAVNSAEHVPTSDLILNRIKLRSYCLVTWICTGTTTFTSVAFESGTIYRGLISLYAAVGVPASNLVTIRNSHMCIVSCNPWGTVSLNTAAYKRRINTSPFIFSVNLTILTVLEIYYNKIYSKYN